MRLDRGFSHSLILKKAGTTEVSEMIRWAVPKDVDYETESKLVKNIHSTFKKYHKQKSNLTSFFADSDIIICPASYRTAVGSEKGSGALFQYLIPWNVANWPAAVIPAGITVDGMPFGIQIVGKPWQEHKVLAVAKFLEKKIGGFQPPFI